MFVVISSGIFLSIISFFIIIVFSDEFLDKYENIIIKKALEERLKKEDK